MLYIPQTAKIYVLSSFMSLLDFGEHAEEVSRYTVQPCAFLLHDGIHNSRWVEYCRRVYNACAVDPCGEVA